ncbi:hypothetical protein EJB05_28247, partial [Eragrostis curvula]
MPAVRGTVDPGNQVCASQGQRKPGAKRLRVLAGGADDVAATSTSAVMMPAVELPSGPSPGPAMFSKIKAEVEAAETWTLKTCRAFSTKVRDLRQENEQLKLKISEAAPSSLLAEKEAKITELEAALTGVNKALADLKTAHASEVKSLQDTNATLATSVDTLKDESQALKEKLELKDKDVQLLQQRVSTL